MLAAKLSKGIPETTYAPQHSVETRLESWPLEGSPKMRAIGETLRKAAHTDVAVLLRGETGTGKGLCARWLHTLSQRARGPFITINCPTLSKELLTSELFGHARGSFTGATSDQMGKVEAAQGGTLFLDEISEISPNLQAKLLCFLQEKTFSRVGETKTRRADVRIIAATNRDLEEEVKAGRFRQDLFYRLNVIEVTLPALRERPEEILPLAESFLDSFAERSGRPKMVFSKEAQEALLAYPWPGNVRELQNVMERSSILWPHQTLEREALPERFQTPKPAAPQVGGDCSLEALEQAHIESILARTPNLEDAAKALGIDSSTLWRKRKKLAENHKATRQS